ncbi:Glycoside hydrolase, 38 vacuolar alpha mannosidase [Elasticomyces elasticus]|uniref:alpha-mannosidase n=1 Tax=Exophiala sideris TaxID=1016849 RepID=A0ABR0J862_9EURO|nr:Glycoside hydrolase, 38 vacuolar alpha mannosidase [Elasticomyces elasticus]KAK5028913.1 Glycoside hydrolase, 38 vacuolar alpha mannosidase [Exophiala sideris]KAK5035782.1 Glycoside hydrolase, 38 vacuolar alpha mannosidase [Exophiala sideris]KAK5057417.1 Glycoside hydrolase, 38 vacuolar alpha mannosidase [Exophiala sideris]KAK5181607.1 Glycoside hydrolase, 38 vacuolar alpha mannosidase [Eurotiomycetes sp. CCFEE 6388]
MGGETSSRATSQYPQLATGPVGKLIEGIYTDRLRQLTSGGQYEKENLQAKLCHNTNDDEDHVKISVYSPPNLTRPTFKDATSHDFRPTHRGEAFGPSWSTHWFRIKLTVPENMRDGEHLEFHWDANNEGMVWTHDGNPLQGLTGGGDRTEWILPESWRDGKEHTFYIEMACNGMFGNAPGGDSIQPPDPDKSYQLSVAKIVDVNLAARQLHVDFWIIGDAAREFPGDSWERHEALQVCNQIMDVFIAGEGSTESIKKGREIAQKYIGKNVDSAKVYDSDEKSIVYAIGHCHIDTCWLWPWAETKRKVARSWSNQCDLMDRYPEHRFAVSQAQQYKWLKEHYPYVFDRVKTKVKEGKFQPIGGSWVEHDTNMPSGESLVRQFLYGQRFFESNFGERCQTFWLPDTFGYSSQLPQICRLANMSHFFTQKLSWNNINNFPHTTFNWVSLDGSQVICHMAPSETYTADANFGDVRRSVTQHKSMDQDNTSLLVFGKGDGGGGPTRDMLEKLRRCRGVSDTTGMLPRVHMGRSVDEFFADLEKKIANGTKLVTWYGELYFELHRGTYTTQANNKLNNRKQEIMLHDIEYLATLASLKSKSYKYPKKEIDEIWENVLLCQFHDCLPGSSIEMCYDDSDELYAHNAKLGVKLKEEALTVLGLSHNLKAKAELAAVNTAPWKRSELVPIPQAQAKSQEQKYTFVSGGSGLVKTHAASAIQSTASVEEVKKGVFVMRNSKFKVEIEEGVITSLIDLKADREVIAKGGKANQLVIFDDKPLYWQAWDVEVFHLDSRKELKSEQSEVVENGPYRVSVSTKTKVSKDSWVKTTISLDATDGQDDLGFLSVEAEVEWRENMKFLKVEFPVDVVNTEATYETQYGIIKRPTHYNTSWDMAKFEVCCHKFADLSEADYGVSILNDSKYGFATCGNLMRLSLLRAPKAPDAHADMGRHRIKWAIMPHQGALGPSTVQAAYNFNHPMTLVSLVDDRPKELFNAIHLTGGKSLVLDCIKRGEDDEDVTRGELSQRSGQSVILRIYESLGGKSRGTIETTLPVKKAFKTNVLEDDLDTLTISGKNKLSINIELRPFEVATFRLQL